MRYSISKEVLDQIVAHLGSQPYIVAAPIIDGIKADIVPITEVEHDTLISSDSEVSLTAVPDTST